MVRYFTRLPTMTAGFLAAAVGDWLLAVMGCHRGTSGFLGGVAAFSVAQLLWTSAHLRETRPDGRVFVLLVLPLSLFVGLRLWPVLNPVECAVLFLYALISSLNVATAWATRRLFYLGGALLLLVSDVMIGGRWLGVPGVSRLVGPVYFAAELSMLASFFCSAEPRRTALRVSTAAEIAAAAVVCCCFVLASILFPCGYDPFRRMLSALGRVKVGAVTYPASHFLFVVGMLFSAAGVVAVSRLRRLSSWGAVLTAGGFLVIALVPEDVSELGHNFGCWQAAVGGGLMLLQWARESASPWIARLWSVILLLPLLAIGLGLILHGLRLVPFAPWVPTAQKGVILSFAAWVVWLSVRPQTAICRRACVLVLVAGIVVGACAANSMEVRFG